MNIEEFRRKYPLQKMQINGADFTYRYYKNDSAKATLVLLTGGIGLSDLFYAHFDRFARDFSVITFDYHESQHNKRSLRKKGDFTLFKQMSITDKGDSLFLFCCPAYSISFLLQELSIIQAVWGKAT